MREEWKMIEGYEGLYSVSNLGRVKSLRSNRILSPTDNGNGYMIVSLRYKGHRKSAYVHRLVAAAFVGRERPEQTYINHLDYDKKNNIAANLEWCTQRENVLYSVDRMKKPRTVTHAKTGEKGIYYRPSRSAYRVVIGKKEYSYKKTLEEAVAYRDMILRGGCANG